LYGESIILKFENIVASLATKDSRTRKVL